MAIQTADCLQDNLIYNVFQSTLHLQICVTCFPFGGIKSTWKTRNNIFLFLSFSSHWLQ